MRRVILIAVVAILFSLTYYIVWFIRAEHYRAPIRSALDRVEVGMDFHQVRRIMAPFMRGSGMMAQCDNPFITGGGQILADGSVLHKREGQLWRKIPDGRCELFFAGLDIFRHSDLPEFNADWAMVWYDKGGRVVKKTFNPD